LMISELLQSRSLHTDDTPVKNPGHEPGTTDKARFWIYHGDRDHPYNVFDFTVNHKRDGPQAFLADFQGYLHADAFSGYDALYLPDPRPGKAPIIEVACNAHARRKFFEAKGSDDLRAHQALGYYRALYALERSAVVNNFNDEQTLQVRQEFSVPLLGQFKAWLDKERDQVLPKSPMAEAIGYALNNWTALVRYTEAGFLSIDNNVGKRPANTILDRYGLISAKEVTPCPYAIPAIAGRNASGGVPCASGARPVCRFATFAARRDLLKVTSTLGGVPSLGATRRRRPSFRSRSCRTRPCQPEPITN
jgi:hypothetical protein